MQASLQDIEALVRMGDWSEAVARLGEYCRDNPADTRAQHYLGNLLLKVGQLPAARQAFEQVLRLQPDSIPALLGLCAVWHALEHPHKVIDCLQRAIAISPQQPELHYNLGLVFESLGLLDEAGRACQACLSLSPGFVPATALQATVLARRQAYRQAMELLDPLLKREVVHPRLADVYVSICHKVGHCEEAVALAQSAVASPGISRQDRMCLQFSTGRALDRMGRYAEAFEQFRQANELRGAVQDVQGLQRYVDEIIGAHDADPARGTAPGTHAVPRMIFIVGMPRSGTTLVEQILASHPEVCAAGELRGMLDIAHTASQLTGVGTNYPQCMHELETDQLAKLRRAYLSGLPEVSRGTRMVTDKQPGNFLNLGLVRALFPDAAIIHCSRDPRDTCLSCYFQNFTGLAYTYDLEALGRTWLIYRQMMRHWEAIGIPMLDVVYEAVVGDVETQSRRLLEFCGLPWSDACLRFYENERPVSTVSHGQVREPIYRGSLGRWQHYREYLGPLLDALQDAGVDRSGPI